MARIVWAGRDGGREVRVDLKGPGCSRFVLFNRKKRRDTRTRYTRKDLPDGGWEVCFLDRLDYYQIPRVGWVRREQWKDTFGIHKESFSIVEPETARREFEGYDVPFPETPPVTDPLDERNEYIHKEVCTNREKPYKKIRAEVNKHPGWQRLGSDQGVKDAAQSYADAHGLPPLPSRKPGKRK
jgi:hypothetical protein